MKIKLTFETDSDNEDFFEDKKEIERAVKNLDYVIAITNIQDELRTIVKYRFQDELTVEQIRDIIENFYYETFPEIIRKLELE